MTALILTTVIADSLFAAILDLQDAPTVRVVAWIIGLLVVLVVAWGASVAFEAFCNRQIKTNAEPTSPVTVFDELCVAQQLSDDVKRQLIDGAAELKLDSPATLFVDSGLLRKLTESDRADANDFETLLEQLFPGATDQHAEPEETAIA